MIGILKTPEGNVSIKKVWEIFTCYKKILLFLTSGLNLFSFYCSNKNFQFNSIHTVSQGNSDAFLYRLCMLP